ncbi:MAG: high frequency lysogenization protein HflD [Pseudomonadales bacterium]
MSRTRDQAIALAGVAQAALAVYDIAHTGSADQAIVEPLIKSLFVFDPEDTESVYGGIDQLTPGIASLKKLLGNDRTQAHKEQLNYVMGMIYLQHKLSKQPETLDIIKTRLDHAILHSEHFATDHSVVHHNLAGIYQDTISTQGFRIQVAGNPTHLQQENNAAAIRALLLSGIRSAILWRQLGGSRIKLIWQRKRLVWELGQLV